jgi:hypothetical protein
MSYSESLTQTFSVTDIGKVIDCIAADLDMNFQSTGLLTREVVKKYAALSPWHSLAILSRRTSCCRIPRE